MGNYCPCALARWKSATGFLTHTRFVDVRSQSCYLRLFRAASILTNWQINNCPSNNCNRSTNCHGHDRHPWRRNRVDYVSKLWELPKGRPAGTQTTRQIYCRECVRHYNQTAICTNINTKQRRRTKWHTGHLERLICICNTRSPKSHDTQRTTHFITRAQRCKVPPGKAYLCDCPS